MKIKLSLIVLCAFLAFSCEQQSEFWHVEDGKFYQGNSDEPYYYIGTNFWYGGILGSWTDGGDIERLRAELDSLSSLGLDNLRILVGGDGPDGIPTRVEPTLQKEAGVYDDRLLEGLDILLTEMSQRGMSAVLYLNNAWEWSGGYGQYLEWAGAGKAVIPAIEGYGKYMEYASGFVTNEKAKEMFADHVKYIVSRTNSVTGIKYSEDPTIFSWQISNEPRCFSSDTAVQTAFVNWIWETAALIKSLDPNHMVSTGSEGTWGCENSVELFERIHSCPDIDYITVHIWPYNWSWVTASTLDTDLQKAINETDKYLDVHIKSAEKFGKPVAVEEFGFPRDGFLFTKEAGTTSRDKYYSHIFSRVAESAKAGGNLAGANFWGWGGFAERSETSIYWQKGDDYCGDPAQEQQGLNSVYASDTSTLNVIKDYEKLLHK